MKARRHCIYFQKKGLTRSFHKPPTRQKCKASRRPCLVLRRSLLSWGGGGGCQGPLPWTTTGHSLILLLLMFSVWGDCMLFYGLLYTLRLWQIGWKLQKYPSTFITWYPFDSPRCLFPSKFYTTSEGWGVGHATLWSGALEVLAMPFKTDFFKSRNRVFRAVALAFVHCWCPTNWRVE